jgi:hypothetical protein
MAKFVRTFPSDICFLLARSYSWMELNFKIVLDDDNHVRSSEYLVRYINLLP